MKPVNHLIPIFLIFSLFTVPAFADTVEDISSGTLYLTYDGRWISSYDLEKGTSNYPYLIQDDGFRWIYTADNHSVYIPKTFDVKEYPTKISPCLTYSKTALANNMISHNTTVAYLVFPYSLSGLKTWSDENNIQFGLWSFKAGSDHISIYDEFGTTLDSEYYQFKIVNDEIRLYFIKSAANELEGDITFEMHSWILDGYTSSSNAGPYFIDQDLSNMWIKDTIAAGGENVYHVEKTSGYSPDGEGSFTFFYGSDSSTELSNKFTTSGTIEVSGGETVLNADDGIICDTSFGNGYIVESRAKANEQDIAFVGFYDVLSGFNDRLTLDNSDAQFPDDFDRFQFVNLKGGSDSVTSVDGWNDFRNTYYTYSITRVSNSEVIFGQGSSSYSYTNSAYIPTIDLKPAVLVWDSSQTSTLTVDWIRVRKYTPTEPTITVVDKTTYYEVHVSSEVELADYEIAIPCNQIGITSSTESLLVYRIYDNNGDSGSIMFYSPTGLSYTVYENGTYYSDNSSDDIVYTDSSSNYSIYVQQDGLTVLTDPEQTAPYIISYLPALLGLVILLFPLAGLYLIYRRGV